MAFGALSLGDRVLRPAQREFYTIQEVAGLIGLSDTRVYIMAKSPKLRKLLPPFIRIGRLYRFPAAEYERWKQDGIKNV